MIIHALQNKVIKGIITAQKTYLPDHSVYEMLLEFGMANQSSRDLSNNVKRGNKEKIRQGGWPGRAPTGYINNKDAFTIEIDLLRAPLVRKAFELYATGQYSLKNISDKMFDAGLTSRPGKKIKGGNKIHKGKILKLLNNSFYYGMMKYNGKLHPGKHKTIISQTLFEQCQEIMDGKAKPRMKRHFFLFRGLCTCAGCGCMITAEKQRGHSYYHCTNGKGNCQQKRQFLRGYILEKMILDKVIRNINIDNNQIQAMYLSALDKSRSGIEFSQKKISEYKKEIEVLELRLSRLTDMFLDGRVEQAMFDEKKVTILNDKQNLLMRLEKAESTPDILSTIEQTKKCLKAFAVAKNRYSEGTEAQKRELLFLLLSNITLKDKEIVDIQYKSPYNFMAKAPNNGDFSLLWAVWDEVRTWVENNSQS